MFFLTDPSTCPRFFSTFDMDKLRRIWKEPLKIRKIAKFESNLLKTNGDIASQSRQISERFVWCGYKLAPSPPPSPTIRTSVNVSQLSISSYIFARADLGGGCRECAPPPP